MGESLFSSKLISPERALRRARDIARSLELLYGGPAVVRVAKIPTADLLFTEPYLERSKLGMVLRAMLLEGYSAPITVLWEDSKTLVLDGHHRAYVYCMTEKSLVDSVVIRLTTYSGNPARKTWRFWQVGLYSGEQPRSPLKRLWRFMAGAIHFYTKMYRGTFRLRLETMPLDGLTPTQPFVEAQRIGFVKRSRVFGEPILVLRRGNRNYILDGHVRALLYYLLGKLEIRAVVLYPVKQIDVLGIERVVDKMRLETIADVSIV